MNVPRPCRGCGEVTSRGTRCEPCQRAWDRERNAQPKRKAYSDPLYRAQPKGGTCHICGKDGADTRDHVVPIAQQMRRFGEVIDHRTLPAHRSCNAARGARDLNRWQTRSAKSSGSERPVNPGPPTRTHTKR